MLNSDGARKGITAAGITVGIIVVLRLFFLQGMLVQSTSMNPTLLAGDVMLVNRAATGAPLPFLDVRVPGYARTRRCDIVLFQLPGGDGVTFAKRIVGVPGDTLLMKERVLFVNGTKVPEPYTMTVHTKDVFDSKFSWQHRYLATNGASGPYAPTRDNWGPLAIPPDHYFVLGDERDGSLDSRYWGFVQSSQIEGRAAFVSFSYGADPNGEQRVRWDRFGKSLSCPSA